METSVESTCENLAPHDAHDRCADVTKKYRCTAHFRCNGGLVGCCINGEWMIPGCDA